MKNQRFYIRDLKIIDSESNPVSEIYIRELLDASSAEFQRSRLSARQKMDVIQEIGLDKLTKVLDDCFRQNSKGYDASSEAELAVTMLGQALERQSL